MTTQLWTPKRAAEAGLPRDLLEAVLRANAEREAERIGHNVAHILVQRANGRVEDFGYHPNLLTNAGRDLIAAAQGHAVMKEGALTAIATTSATPSGGGMTVDQYKGWKVYVPVTGLTTAPVYGNIGSNSATVLTLDQWWTAADATGTLPAATNGYSIIPTADFRFMGITADATAAAAGDTTLASEVTTNGGSRALATYAHTGGTNTYTLVKAFSFTGTLTALDKIGLFTALNTTAAGIMGYEVVFAPVLTVGNGDTGTITWTGTLA